MTTILKQLGDVIATSTRTNLCAHHRETVAREFIEALAWIPPTDEMRQSAGAAFAQLYTQETEILYRDAFAAQFRAALRALAREERSAPLSTPSEVHNEIVGQIVRSIVRAPIEAGGGASDVLVIAESVLVGIILSCVRRGGDDEVLDMLMAGAKRRIAKIRLMKALAAGEA